MAGSKPMRTEFGIRQRLESCVRLSEKVAYFYAFSYHLKNVVFTIGFRCTYRLVVL